MNRTPGAGSRRGFPVASADFGHSAELLREKSKKIVKLEIDIFLQSYYTVAIHQCRAFLQKMEAFAT